MLKRRIIQTLSLILYNLETANFKTGAVSKSPLKRACVPGLNCYSCPGAIASCPIGALQSALAEGRTPLLAAGFLLLFAVTLARTVCGFLCPFGLIQEMLYKIPSRKLPKTKFTRRLSALKYGLLVIFVMGLPLAAFLANGFGAPFFCEFICPAGTLEAGIPLLLADNALRGAAGYLFICKIAVLVAVIVLSIFCFRVFCRFVCPLGALYGLFNRYAIFGLKLDETVCIHCGNCIKKCGMDTKIVNDRECIRCGKCAGECPVQAITGTLLPKKSIIKEKL